MNSTNWINQKSIVATTVAFTQSHNKCYNIFVKHLFSIVIGHSLIFYYFISIYKKLTSQ